MKIGIVGDGLIDRYHVGRVRGLSAEAPIPVVDVDMQFDLPGGAANIRSNLRGLGVEAVMLFKGLDSPQNYPIKNRLMVGDHQLARWDENDWCSPFQKEDLIALLDCDGFVVADYCKGSITEEVIQVLRETSRPVFVDTKGDPKPWLGSGAILFPNRAEYEKYKDVYEWFPRLVVKQGENGISWVEYGKATLTRPAVGQTVRCVNGAGDSALAGFVTAFMSGTSIEYALRYANAAAAVAVEQPYTTTVTQEEVNARMVE